MIEKLIEINEKLIKLNEDNENELRKQLLIKEILKEKDCFSKIDIEKSYSILRDLKIPEKNLRSIYMKLI